MRNKKVWLSLMIFLALTATIYRMSTFRPMKNFHEIDPGKFYRSAQLTGEEFEETVKKYGIKTVINLRGKQPGEWWYDDEKATLDRLGVRMESLGFSTEHLQFQHEWAKYLEFIRTAEYPILVHCRSGADRTSEATAVYAMEKMGLSKQQAFEYMTFKYLHVPLFHPAKTFFIGKYRGADWLLNEYDPCTEEFIEHAGNRCTDAQRKAIENSKASEAPTKPDVKSPSELSVTHDQNG